MNIVCKLFGHEYKSILARVEKKSKTETSLFLVKCKRCGYVDWNCTTDELMTKIEKFIQSQIEIGELAIKEHAIGTQKNIELVMGATLTYRSDEQFRNMRAQVGILKHVLSNWRR